MSGTAFPAIGELVPHSNGMLLLDRILEHDEKHTICSASADAGADFSDSSGNVPSWLGIEYMAQCAAVHGGLEQRKRNAGPRPGLLLGSRRFRLHADALPVGCELRVSARHHRGTSGLVAFDCSIGSAANGEVLAEGRVNLYILDHWGELREQRT